MSRFVNLERYHEGQYLWLFRNCRVGTVGDVFAIPEMAPAAWGNL